MSFKVLKCAHAHTSRPLLRNLFPSAFQNDSSEKTSFSRELQSSTRPFSAETKNERESIGILSLSKLYFFILNANQNFHVCLNIFSVLILCITLTRSISKNGFNAIIVSVIQRSKLLTK